DRPELLAPFDRLVIATGAAYRFGLGPIATGMLDNGAARWPGVSRLFSAPRIRDWFYYRARRGTAERFKRLAKPGQSVTVIGAAVRAGKSKQAIGDAFEAALLSCRRITPSRPPKGSVGAAAAASRSRALGLSPASPGCKRRRSVFGRTAARTSRLSRSRR